MYAEPDKKEPLYGFDVHLDPEADERWNDSTRTVGDFAEIVSNLNAVLRDMSQHYFGATIAPDVYTLSGIERHKPLFPQEGLREAIENLRIRAIANPGLRKGIVGEYLDRPGTFEQYLRVLGSPLHRRGLNQKEQDYFSQLFWQEA